MDKKVVITIARQYGSGGKTVGEMYAAGVRSARCWQRIWAFIITIKS